jgi:hypothetical protein
MQNTRAGILARDRCVCMLFTDMHRLSVDNLWKTRRRPPVSLSA